MTVFADKHRRDADVVVARLALVVEKKRSVKEQQKNGIINYINIVYIVL